jgi:hypothetical protein
MGGIRFDASKSFEDQVSPGSVVTAHQFVLHHHGAKPASRHRPSGWLY